MFVYFVNKSTNAKVVMECVKSISNAYVNYNLDICYHVKRFNFISNVLNERMSTLLNSDF